MYRVGLAEDHNIVRQGLVSLLKIEESTRVLFDVSNGAELLEELKKDVKPDVILLDLEMPILDGRKALEIITSKYPFIKVIILSMHTKLDFISECIAIGAHGFLSKDNDFDIIVDAIHAVIVKGFYFDENVSKSLVTELRRKPLPTNGFTEPLNAVDIQVIQLICEGHKTPKIAELLFLSQRTIEGRRLNIYRKTQTSNLVELVVYAIKNGIYKIY